MRGGGRGEKASWGPLSRTGNRWSTILCNSHLKTQARITRGIPTAVRGLPRELWTQAAEQVQ